MNCRLALHPLVSWTRAAWRRLAGTAPTGGSWLLFDEHPLLGVGASSSSDLAPEGMLLALLLLAATSVLALGGLWRLRNRQLLEERVGRIRESVYREQAEQALSDREELLSEIINVNTDGMLVLDAQGCVLFANPSAATLLGARRNELIGKLLGLFTAAGQCELELPHGQGPPRIVEARTIPMVWEGEQASLLSLRDVTRRREAEARLAQSEALLQSTFHSMQDLVLVIDPDHRVRLSNWRGLEHVPQEQRDGCPCCHELLYHRKTPCPGCELHEVFESGAPLTTERTLKVNGRLYEESVSPMRDETGRVKKVVKHLRDITEHRAMQREVEQSERLYRLMAENMPNGAVHMFDRELRYVISEGAILGELGLDGDALLGKRLGEALPPDVTDTLEPCYRAALQGQTSMTEVELLGRIFEIRTLPLEDAEGRVIAGMVLSQDITMRKQRERELRASEARLSAVFENVAVGVCTLDLEGRFLSTNDLYTTILGYENSEFSKLDYLAVTAGHERSAYREMFRDLLEGRKRSLFLEKDNLRKDGSLVPVRVGISTVRDEEDRPQYLVAVMEDISDRRRAELELAGYRDSLERNVEERTSDLSRALEQTREAREQVDLILKSVSEGLMVTDLENRVLLMNPHAEQLLGLELQNVFNMPLDQAIHLDVPGGSYREAFCEHIENAKASATYHFDFVMPGEGGEKRTLHGRTAVILDASGWQTGLVTIISDVTTERETDRMKSEFISTAAHELRTPLTNIQGYSELMVSRQLSPEQMQSYADKINSGAMRLRTIVDDLLDISRIESGKGFSFNKQAVNIMQLMENRLEEFSARNPRHQFTSELPANSVMAWVDAGRLEQVLDNLLSNSVKYSPNGGKIMLRCICDGDFCLVEIRDQGLGMTQNQLERVFEKFYRAHAEGGAIQGTGLGLSIVQYIVTSHGGRVWLESEPGNGTSVFFTLPMLSPLEQVHADMAQARQTPESAVQAKAAANDITATEHNHLHNKQRDAS